MFLVGMARFELTTPTSRTWCSTRLSYTPTKARILLTFIIQVNEGQSRYAPGGYPDSRSDVAAGQCDSPAVLTIALPRRAGRVLKFTLHKMFE